VFIGSSRECLDSTVARQEVNLTATEDARNMSFEQYITSLSKDDYTIWKATKKFKRPQISTPPIRKAGLKVI
jgi:hypothetical protein